MIHPPNFMKSIRSAGWLLCLFSASACSSATSPTPTIKTSGQATAPSDAVAPTRAYRTFRAPPKHVMPAPTQVDDIPMVNGCRQVSSSVFDHERARLIAALDETMRGAGGLVLPLRSHVGLNLTSHKTGHEFQGPKGERLMIVGSYSECSKPPPFVLTVDYEVFAAFPVAVGKKKRVVDACAGDCRGCGMATPDVPAIAEIPEGSHVVQAREVKVSIATNVVFEAKAMCMPRP